ncbi:MAG: dihydropteroate synthase, partial [Bacteroidales bacterium]|nr:dihydropteroate synthase [Bacteroidales bacterium]
MKKAGIYLRPVGRLVGGTGIDDGASDQLVLNGRAKIKFSGIELIERQGEWTGNRTFRMDEIFDGLVQSQISQNEAHAILHRVVGSRPDLAGLALDRTRIMGIVNATPDSFSDGGRFAGSEAAIEHALKLDEEGADILDIGGESTRPGATPVWEGEEADRIIPVIDAMADEGVALSVDTRNSFVMEKATKAGAHIINDVSALTHDPDSMEFAVSSGAPVILMHALGDPETMQDKPDYDHVLLDVYDYL